MKAHESRLEEYRNLFLQTGRIHEKVRDYIADGWMRCKEKKIDPDEGKGVKIEDDAFAIIRKNNRDFIEVAKVIMRETYHSLMNSDSVMFITDANGCILEQYRDETAFAPTEHTNLIPGYRWREEENGMTSMDLTMRLDRPVEIIGAEHYCKNHHICAGFSAPVHGEDGEILGSLNLITLLKPYSKHSLGVVTSGAALIENQMRLNGMLKLFRVTFDTMSEGMLIISDRYEIKEMNESAKRILDLSNEEGQGFDIRKMLRLHSFDGLQLGKMMELNFYKKDGLVPCIGEVDIIELNQQTKYFTMVFKAAKTINKLVNKMAGYQALYTFSDIITENEKMLDLIGYAQKISSIDCSVLIVGPSGTGKEIFAHSIHNASPRSSGPFIAINCAALPRELVESEIFGYEAGAFTGAKAGGQAGKFELADGGTLFFDEVGELPIDIQSKLLRVLDNCRVTRLGGKGEKAVDVRVITATNRNLEEEIERKNFRLDLYYRINTITLNIPSLKERGNDIRLLSRYFLQKLNQENEKKIAAIEPEVTDAFYRMDWPGNIRQLQNMITRAYFVCENSRLSLKDFPNQLGSLREDAHPADPDTPAKPDAALPSMKEVEKQAILQAIASCQGNLTAAAARLKIAKSTLYRKIKQYHIVVQRVYQKE